MLGIFHLYVQYSGWLGLVLGLLVGPAQLLKILRTGEVKGISVATYTFLNLALVHYLIHAIDIKDAPFIVAQALNLLVNATILIYIVRRRHTCADSRS